MDLGRFPDSLVTFLPGGNGFDTGFTDKFHAAHLSRLRKVLGRAEGSDGSDNQIGVAK